MKIFQLEKGNYFNWRKENIPMRKRKLFQLGKENIPIRKRKIFQLKKEKIFQLQKGKYSNQ